MRSNLAALILPTIFTLSCGGQAPAAIEAPDAAPPTPAAGAPGPEAPPPRPSAPVDAETRSTVIDRLATSLGVLYVFPEMGATLERELRGRHGVGAYSTFVEPAALADALTADLQALSHDLHLRVVFMPNGPNVRPPGPPGAPRDGIAKVEVLDGNIGYLALDAVPRLEDVRPAIEAAFARLLHTNALIIDNRNNHGGDPNTVAFYVSYLSEGPPVVVNTFHSRDGQVQEFRTTDLGALSYGVARPVFVLTSGATFSGGEELSYDLQASKRAVLIGERTGGGANPARPTPLGSGFTAIIPFAQPINPITGKNWEGVGVTPDVAVPAERALDEALERAREAIAKSLASAPEAGRR